MKPEAAVDDWEAIATDEEKGETTSCVLFAANRLFYLFSLDESRTSLEKESRVKIQSRTDSGDAEDDPLVD